MTVYSHVDLGLGLRYGVYLVGILVSGTDFTFLGG
jgi:hypothetical protein